MSTTSSLSNKVLNVPITIPGKQRTKVNQKERDEANVSDNVSTSPMRQGVDARFSLLNDTMISSKHGGELQSR